MPGLTHKRRGREPIQIDELEFQAVVTALEKSQTFKTHGELWAAVVATTWAQGLSPRPLTVATAAQKARQFGLTILTHKGVKGAGLKAARALRVGNWGKRKSRAVPEEQVAPIRDTFPLRLAPVIDRLAAGSLKAAVRAKCEECSNFQREEIRLCTVEACPLHPFRPFK